MFFLFIYTLFFAARAASIARFTASLFFVFGECFDFLCGGRAFALFAMQLCCYE